MDVVLLRERERTRRSRETPGIARAFRQTSSPRCLGRGRPNLTPDRALPSFDAPRQAHRRQHPGAPRSGITSTRIACGGRPHFAQITHSREPTATTSGVAEQFICAKLATHDQRSERIACASPTGADGGYCQQLTTPVADADRPCAVHPASGTRRTGRAAPAIQQHCWVVGAVRAWRHRWYRAERTA